MSQTIIDGVLPKPEPRYEAFRGTAIYGTPAHVRFIKRDRKGRRVTQFVCDCNGMGRRNYADAKLIARLLNRHAGLTIN